jgi:phage gp29-like protein
MRAKHVAQAVQADIREQQIVALRTLFESPEFASFLAANKSPFDATTSATPSQAPRGKRAKSTVGSGESVEQNPQIKTAPRQHFPITVGDQNTSSAVAPPPLADRYPTVIGAQLQFNYVATVARLCTTGYRQQAVDLWRELLEQDPHLASVLQKRILSVANGELQILPADLEEDDPEYKLAVRACEMVKREFARIPNLTGALCSLLWAIYYACTAAEIIWSRDADGWHVDRLEFVHTRRLAWPDMQSWDAYVWDQGQVYGWNSPWGSTPTNSGVFGLRLADWPGKFIFFAPQLFGDYPTRDGLARQVAMWAAFKKAGVRGAIDYLERFAKGFVDITFTTTATGEPRGATDEDIAFAQQLANVLGPGNGRTATHPDSIKIEPQAFDKGGAGSKLTWSEWTAICNSEMSKIVLGGTLGTDVGKGGGNRALGEVQERGEVDLEQFDATVLAETLKRDLVTWLVRLNMPEALHVVPRVLIDIEAEPDAASVCANIAILVDRGAPLDAEDAAMKAGFKLVPNEEKDAKGKPKARRLFKSDFIDPSLVDPSLKSQEAKDAEQADKDNAQALELEKAKAPKVLPPGAQGASQGGQGAANTNGKQAAKPKSPKKMAKANKKMADDAIAFLLSSKRGDKKMALEVYEELLGDYPAKYLDWVLAGHWEGPKLIPLDAIDFAERDEWRASHEDLSKYVERLQKALAGDGERKPVVMVKTPSNSKLIIVDGHHRTLACEKADEPVLAYVAEVHTNKGPWLTLHGAQKQGSSEASYREPSRLSNAAE